MNFSWIMIILIFKWSYTLSQAGDRETQLRKETASEDPTLPGGSCQQIYGNDSKNYSSFIESTSEIHQQMGTVADEVPVGKKCNHVI